MGMHPEDSTSFQENNPLPKDFLRLGFGEGEFVPRKMEFLDYFRFFIMYIYMFSYIINKRQKMKYQFPWLY